jgi:hypothetical protein
VDDDRHGRTHVLLQPEPAAGYAPGDPVTYSVWTVPLASVSYQSQAWRWNLDQGTDPHGNAIAYFYNTQTNYYAEDNGTTGAGQYVQGGRLAKIEHWLRSLLCNGGA